MSEEDTALRDTYNTEAAAAAAEIVTPEQAQRYRDIYSSIAGLDWYGMDLDQGAGLYQRARFFEGDTLEELVDTPMGFGKWRDIYEIAENRYSSLMEAKGIFNSLAKRFGGEEHSKEIMEAILHIEGRVAGSPDQGGSLAHFEALEKFYAAEYAIAQARYLRKCDMGTGYFDDFGCTKGIYKEFAENAESFLADYDLTLESPEIEETTLPRDLGRMQMAADMPPVIYGLIR
jgi:hypothetical protein